MGQAAATLGHRGDEERGPDGVNFGEGSNFGKQLMHWSLDASRFLRNASGGAPLRHM